MVGSEKDHLVGENQHFFLREIMSMYILLPTSHHGGIGILFKTSLKLCVKPVNFIIRIGITYAVIYRPPPSPANGLKTGFPHRDQLYSY